MAEEWRIGFVTPHRTTYEVSSLGRVRRQKHNGSIWRYLSLRSKKNGYPVIQYHDLNKKQKRICVHCLVAKAFVPNPQDLPFVDHRNGVRTDNRVVNLTWVSRGGNARNYIGKGYSLHETGKYQAKIKTNGHKQHLGTFDTREEARATYLEAKRRLHPECLARLPSV